ncbi:MAG: PAS domain S-box protein, partial [Bacteroidota bacterium]|nr:PAS domain S-box protein [Bacteroidota bacterium]
QRFGAFLDHASIGVIVVNRKQEIQLMNPFALQLFGYTLEELSGKTIETFIPQRFHDRHQGHQERYYANQQSRPMGIGMDLYAIKKDGTEFPVEVSLGMYTAGEETFVIAFVSDITIRKKGEEEIKKLNAELEKKVRERTDELAESIQQLEKQIKETEEVEIELRKSLEKEKELNELKSRFVSMASHEFRTPLSTVLSSIFLLQKYTSTDDQPKREKHIERIVSAVHTLTDILNDFLSVGKIEEGKVAPKYSLFNIKDHIQQTIHELNTILKKGQTVAYEHTGEEYTRLDPSLLKHISLNLLSNAIKFSPENSVIRITTHREGQTLRFEIRDKGLGIAKEDQQHLFERFFRGTNVTAIQGTGLGLHIVQKYTELMGGKITCISELEKGTCFVIEFALENE